MTPALKRALDQAAIWHRHQLRKYPGVEVPYVSHLAAVGILLARYGFDDEVIMAGVLHDVLEDTPVTSTELHATFGARIATLVQLVSEEDKSLPWEERKRLALAQFMRNPWEAQAITVADKIDNLRSILVVVRHYGDPWPRLKRTRAEQIAGFRAFATAVSSLPAHALLGEYHRALADVEAEA